MENVNNFFNLNFVQLVLGLLVAMAGLTAIVVIITSFFDKVLKRPIGFFKMFGNDHKLLEETIREVKVLSDQRKEDVKQSMDHDKKIEENLNTFITDVKDSLEYTNAEIKNFYNKRTSDREQSFRIQKELTEAQTKIANSVENISNKIDKMKSDTDERFLSSEKKQNERVQALVAANKEMLAAKINEKYKEYIHLGGIPADEVDEFTSMHDAYNGVGGNHHGDAKYNYVMSHLPVIPVETKLIN